MSHKSSDKGKSYERKIAAQLSKWCGLELIRTPMSGAWAGTSGDILPKNRMHPFPFTIECKKQEAWSMEALLAGEGLFYSWWEQANREVLEDAEMTGISKKALLIFTRNRKPDYIAVEIALVSKFTNLANIAYISLPKGQGLIVMHLVDFLTNIKYESVAQQLVVSTTAAAHL